MTSECFVGPIGGETPIRFQDWLPEAVDVAVIGGGIIGICSALHIARAGLSVVVLEKGRVAGEQSSRNWGWVRQQGRDPAELQIMMESIRLWRDIDSETRQATGFRQAGVCYLASSEKEMARLEGVLQLAQEHQLDTRRLTADEAYARVGNPSGANARWVGGIVTPSDGRAEPGQAVPAMARLAQHEGAAIRENCAVRRISIKGGTVAGVETEAGNVAAEQVVLAGGAWSSLFARRHGLDMPLLSVRSSVAATAPLPPLMDGNCADETFAIRRRNDGGYTLALKDDGDHFIGPDSFRHLLAFAPQWKELLRATNLHLHSPVQHPGSWSIGKDAKDDVSPFEKVRVLAPPPNPKTIAGISRAFAERFPEIGEPKIAATWAGMIDTTPDILPILDHAPDLPGLIVGTGMSGHGFGIGPAFGRIVSDLVKGRPSGHDLAKFSISRFG